jgi:probable HAF family extracellular repeat protein
MNRLACALTTIGLAFAFCLHTRADAQVATFYLAEDIGTLGGDYTVGTAINDNGEIGGYATAADGTYHAIRYSTEHGLEIIDAPIDADAWLVQGYGINNAGDVVGGALFNWGGSSGFVARRGQPMQFLTDALGTYVAAYATAINDAGVVTGVGHGDNTFRWYPTGAFDDLGDGQSRIASWAINPSGQLAGFRSRFIDGTFSTTAFRYSEDLGFVDLGSLGGSNSGGQGINAAGTVVGWSELQPGIGHAFRALSGQLMEDLGTLGGPGSGAQAINDSGVIVGYADLANMQGHAFVYSDAEGMVDLNERVTAGTPRLDIAYGINRSGQIVVTYSVPGQVRTYRLTPMTADLTPPTIDHVAATPATLWPPDGTMRPVAIAVAAHDDRDAAPHCTIVDIAAVENQQLVPTQSDVSVTGDLSVLLRATRSGTSTNRTYTIGVACVDASNNRATASTTVVVPHDSSMP